MATTTAAVKTAQGVTIEGRARAVIEGVTPQVDGGRFPVKRVSGDTVTIEADVFTDGHDAVVCLLRYRHEEDAKWHEVAMAPLGNDRWRASFVVQKLGRYRYTVCAWIDHFLSWRHDFARREDNEDIAQAARAGAVLIREAAARADTVDAARFAAWANQLEAATETQTRRQLALDEDLALALGQWPDRRLATDYERELSVVVDPQRARFSSWYEMFPRSASAEAGCHGTFRDCEARLDYVAGMGFDVLYFPPIHPIGHAKRKGRNNLLVAAQDDVGSPWAIGSPAGGHKAILAELGTLAEFRQFVARARERGIEVALDIAFQCAPDHPYPIDHPGWFRRRPDGTVQYAENPPKKYQDIYPFNFESDDWSELWHELKSIFDFWIGEGVQIFRVDNPHTKPFPFWEWALTDIKSRHPEVLFLSEAFTRPKVMHRLAKLGFSQSYTYFAWRNTKEALTEYFAELCCGEGREYLRPNVWPNTPDILTEYLQHGGRAAFCARLFLAGTLAANYGIYGPAFELLERLPREPGSEEYLDSEKYQIRHWDLSREGSLSELIARINAIRRDNPALQQDWNLGFLDIDNDELIAYRKATDDATNIIVIVVNLDPHHQQSGWLQLDTADLGGDARASYQMHDLLSGARYLWHGRRNYVELAPGMAHIFRLRRRVRSERDFDYFL